MEISTLEPIKINKLFLIGNGFDLSLGMKTRYSDFLLWLLNKYIKITYKQGNRKIYKKADYLSKEYEFFKIHIPCGFDEEEYDSFGAIEKNNIEIQHIFNGMLIDRIFDFKNAPWVDIEIEYYNCLKSIYHANKNNKEYLLQQIQKLNSQLDFISSELKKYLANQSTVLNIDARQQVKIKFNDPILFDYEPIIDEKLTDVLYQYEVGDIYFLNFNYTNSVAELYSDTLKEPLINNIHGKLDGQIIFGYGDETDSTYKELEDLNHNDVLKKIKSFSYFSNQNYRRLLSFLDSGEYQVCVYGHSCGLSDRVLLKTIFEHKNCHSIRVYYYESENEYIEKTMNISRHFTDKTLMRRKIINFNPENKITQLSGN